MTQTLTTERLKDLTFHRSKLIFPASHEEAAAMAREILANREAQPVGFYTTVSGRGGVVWHNGAPEDDTAIYTAPPAPAVPQDYFGALVEKARLSADKAMQKYPQPNYVLNKVAEESGEVIKAVIHYTECREEWANVEGEIIDNLAMLIRLVIEGDQVIGFTPPDACRAAMLAQPVSHGCKWIACGEQLPAVGETVLISIDGFISVGESVRSWGGYRYFTSVETGRELTATHWMPLPAEPEGGNIS